MSTETLHPSSLVECDHCDDPTPIASRTAENGQVCSRCADTLSSCDRCDRVTTGELHDAASGDLVCDACAAQMVGCDSCDRLAATTRETTSGYRVCSRCAQRYYWYCDGGCGYLIDTGDYCEDCEAYNLDEYDYGELIHSHSYKPDPEFYGRGPLYLGLELEINTPYGELAECAETAVSHLRQLGYLKEDGSISYGFEIVTHPMSHSYAREAFPWEMLRELRSRGCTSDDAGLHVHVSREAFASSSHVFRWLKFLHRNAQHVTVVARRESDQWAAWSDHDRARAKDYAKGDRYAARYSAINVTNSETFEVRVFASTLERQELQAALDLVAASVEYTRALTVADITAREGWTWPSFIAWAAQSPAYTALVTIAGAEVLPCAC